VFAAPKAGCSIISKLSHQGRHNYHAAVRRVVFMASGFVDDEFHDTVDSDDSIVNE